MALNRKVSVWVWGNIVFGGLIGLPIDALTGGLYKIEPDVVSAELIRRVGRDSSLRRKPPSLADLDEGLLHHHHPCRHRPTAGFTRKLASRNVETTFVHLFIVPAR